MCPLATCGDSPSSLAAWYLWWMYLHTPQDIIIIISDNNNKSNNNNNIVLLLLCPLANCGHSCSSLAAWYLWWRYLHTHQDIIIISDNNNIRINNNNNKLFYYYYYTHLVIHGQIIHCVTDLWQINPYHLHVMDPWCIYVFIFFHFSAYPWQKLMRIWHIGYVMLVFFLSDFYLIF